jgi:hypothetical protein
MTEGQSPGLSASLEAIVPLGEERSSKQSSVSESDVNYRLCEDKSRQGSLLDSDVGHSYSKLSSVSKHPLEHSNGGDDSERNSLSESGPRQSHSRDDISHQIVFHTRQKHKTTSCCATSTQPQPQPWPRHQPCLHHLSVGNPASTSAPSWSNRCPRGNWKSERDLNPR